VTDFVTLINNVPNKRPFRRRAFLFDFAGAPGMTRTCGTQIRNLFFEHSPVFPETLKYLDNMDHFGYYHSQGTPRKPLKSCTGVVQKEEQTLKKVSVQPENAGNRFFGE